MKAVPFKGVLAGVLLSGLAFAHAQDYPVRPLRWVVPYPAGGYADAVTRALAPKLQDALKQTVVVENRPGANSMLGASQVARSAPDGYVLLSVIVGHAVNATLHADRLPFDPVQSFAPVSLVATAPLLLAVNASLPTATLGEFLAYARAHPGKVAYGSSGIGAGAHLASELLRLNEDLELVHVPYKGGAPAVQALVAGDIQMLVDVPSVLMPQVRGGKARALGSFSSHRVPGLDDIPTLSEGGAKPIEGATWVMVLLPAGVPTAIVTRLSDELRAIVSSEDTRQRFAQLGTQAVGSGPAEASRFLASEIAKWRGVILRSGIKAEQ
jgi:tripartite-type tricarboxylate transporter receptor subunit TctC